MPAPAALVPHAAFAATAQRARERTLPPGRGGEDEYVAAERQRDQIVGKGGGGGDGDEVRGEGRGGCPRLADDDEDVGGGGRS